jgi:PAS domain S-box-containing protein
MLSPESYWNLISQVKDYAIFTTDPRGVITNWNEGCKNVLGYDRDEFIGRSRNRAGGSQRPP